MLRLTSVLSAVCVATVLTACGAADEDPDGSPVDEPVAEEPAPPTDADDAAPEGDPPAGDLDAAVAQAVADLADSAGVDPADVEVRTAESVTWSDGSLGCPEPGMMYTQALVPGHRIVLAVEGSEVAYHGAEGSAPTRCDDPQPPSDPGS